MILITKTSVCMYVRMYVCTYNTSVQYNGGFLPDTILLTQGYDHWGTGQISCSGFVFIAYYVIVY